MTEVVSLDKFPGKILVEELVAILEDLGIREIKPANKNGLDWEIPDTQVIQALNNLSDLLKEKNVGFNYLVEKEGFLGDELTPIDFRNVLMANGITLAIPSNSHLCKFLLSTDT